MAIIYIGIGIVVALTIALCVVGYVLQHAAMNW
jgi:hypothetical protein